jgi:CPA2 family monovalent cation:H+ antiporter-2
MSMLLTPALFILYDRVIAPRYAAGDDREPDEMPNESKVIIAGAGRVGGTIDRVLRNAGIATTVIDYSSRRLEIMERFGVRNYYGDASRPDLLHAAGIAEASVLVVAIDDREKITEIVAHVAHNYPNVHLIARAVDRDHVYDLWFAGCRDIIRETWDSTMRMSRSALEALGDSREVAEQVIDIFNRLDRKGMVAVAEVHRSDVPPHENEAYLAKVRELGEELVPQMEAEIAEVRRRAKPDAAEG